MIEARERAVAYVTGQIVSTSTARLMREDDTGRLVLMYGDVSKDRIHVYDFQVKGYVSGTSSVARWNLFHARDKATIELIPTEVGRFSGFDHSSGQWFTVSVTDRIIRVRDIVAGRSRQYSL
jgi:hypothetical protein